MRRILSLRFLLMGAALIYVIVNASAFLFSDLFIFQPQPPGYRDNRDIIKLTTSDSVEISALYMPERKARYTILLSHGNAEDLADIRRIMVRLHEIGFSVFAYDYRGYGTSRGKPSEDGFYRDIDAAWLYLTENLSVPPERIIAYGRSLGTGPSVELAQNRKLAGLILEAPFMSIYRVVTGGRLLLFDKFNNARKIGNVRAPVLIIHGGRDELVPIRHGMRLFEMANEPKYHLWIDKADHYNVDTADAAGYGEAIRAFAGAVGGREARRPLLEGKDGREDIQRPANRSAGVAVAGE